MSRPWDQRPGESLQMYERFRCFLQAPRPRSLDWVVAEAGASIEAIRSTAAKYSWKARVAAYDHHFYQKAEVAAEEHVRSIAQEHAEAWAKARELGLRSIRRLLSEDVDLGPREAVLLLKEATHWERLIEGDATERTETSGKLDLDFSSLSDAEAKALRDLLRKAASG